MRNIPENVLFLALMAALPMQAIEKHIECPPGKAIGLCRDVRSPEPKPMTQAELKAAMVENLGSIKSIYSTRYASGLWKKSHTGWDLEAEYVKAKSDIQKSGAITVNEYRAILQRFILSMKDYHVSLEFHATERSTLPLAICGAEGRYFLAWIDRAKLPENKFPFHVGDEVVTFGDKDTMQAVKALQDKMGGNTAGTDHGLAVRLLTARKASRNAAYGVPSCQGAVTLGIRTKGAAVVKNVPVEWDYKPELIKEPKLEPAKNRGAQALVDILLENGNWLSPMHDMVAFQAGNPYELGDQEGPLPALGPKLSESPKGGNFHAYTYKNEAGKVIGYVRIPGYTPKNDEEAVKEFAGLMVKYQKETDALVIDQVNNPGGSVFYLYALASTLSDKPLEVPKHKIAISQEEIANALNFVSLEKVTTDEKAQELLKRKSLSGIPVTKEFFNDMVDYYNAVIKEWEQGKTLTDPIALNGMARILPHKQGVYTKPVVILTNETCFSGGDFFPAIMQDNKRAVVFGARTAGAGGFVLTHKQSNILGVKQFKLTGSVAVRPDGNVLENLGVQPDVPYDLTVQDLENNYLEYVETVNEALAQLLEAQRR